MADATAGEDGSNPFSFKSFLKRGEGGTSYAETDQKKGERKSDKPGVSKKKTASKKTPIGGIHFPEGTCVVTELSPSYLSGAMGVWINLLA